MRLPFHTHNPPHKKRNPGICRKHWKRIDARDGTESKTECVLYYSPSVRPCSRGNSEAMQSLMHPTTHFARHEIRRAHTFFFTFWSLFSARSLSHTCATCVWTILRLVGAFICQNCSKEQPQQQQCQRRSPAAAETKHGSARTRSGFNDPNV